MAFMKKKSARQPNWTRQEKEILVEEFLKRKSILRGKFSSKLKSIDKQAAWTEITEAVNRSPLSTFRRDEKTVQKKWDNLLSDAKKEISAYKKSLAKTGKLLL